MKSEKKKLVAALICLAVVIVLSQLMSWAFPNLTKTSPQLAVVSFLILFIPMAVSMFYLTGTLMRLVVQEIVDYDERQKALQLPLKQRIGRNLLAWFILACGFGFLVGSFNLPTFYKLSKRGVLTPGRELKTAKGVNVGYEFKVGQKSYKWLIPQQTNEKLYPGAKVTVVYDPLDPQVSIVGPVKPRLDNELISVGMVILLFPAIIMFSFKRLMLPTWRRALSKR
jgi:hypothetical protein